MADSKEVIQERLLSNISDEYDKSEGSFFYDVEKPIAIELERANIILDEIIDKTFADTATGEDLDRVSLQQGLNRKGATKAKGNVTITGVVGSLISKGEMVSSDNVNFIFLEDASIQEGGEIDIEVECEKYGAIGNVPVGAIKYFPKTLEGLQTVTNKVSFSNGYEAENDESLRQRYYTKVRTPSTSGNKWHYLNWAKEVTGVGDAKVYPLWNGNGTVKIVIINANKEIADGDLINKVGDHIEDNRPIGATVTVKSATKKSINIKADIIIDNKKFTLREVQEGIENNLKGYLKGIAFKNNYISYASIGNIIFNTEGVIDYSNLLVNGSNINIILEEEEIPILNSLSLEV